MKRCITFMFFSLAIFCSCNNPLTKSYSPETYEDDMQAIRQSNKVNDDEAELLAKYIVVSRLAGNDLSGKSYGDMLDRIKEIRSNNDNILAQTKNEEQMKREKMEPLLKVNLVEKNFSKIDNKDCLTYTVMFQNTSGKNIKTVIGNIRLNDVLEKEIKKVDILLEDELKTGATFKKVYIVQYDAGNENDKRIRSKDITDLKIEWNPEKIVFDNGRSME